MHCASAQKHDRHSQVLFYFLGVNGSFRQGGRTDEQLQDVKSNVIFHKSNCGALRYEFICDVKAVLLWYCEHHSSPVFSFGFGHVTFST